jgi:hypothetical protein
MMAVDDGQLDGEARRPLALAPAGSLLPWNLDLVRVNRNECTCPSGIDCRTSPAPGRSAALTSLSARSATPASRQGDLPETGSLPSALRDRRLHEFVLSASSGFLDERRQSARRSPRFLWRDHGQNSGIRAALRCLTSDAADVEMVG